MLTNHLAARRRHGVYVRLLPPLLAMAIVFSGLGSLWAQSRANPIRRLARPVVLTGAMQAPADDDPDQPPRLQRGPTLPGPSDVEEVAPPDPQIRVPLVRPDNGQIEIRGRGALVSLIARDASLDAILATLAENHGLNIVCSENINARISITLNNVRLEDALNSILSVAGYSWVRKNNIILVTSIANSANLPAEAQGKQVRVFQLDYASATDMAVTVTGLLSPVGHSYVSQTSKTDNRKTREIVVVEDIPVVLDKVERYILEVDQPPRQVLIEAHILRVDLKKEDRHGVNFTALFGEDFKLQAVGMANPTASPAVFATLDTTKLQSLVECLENTTDAKTLASPKVLVVNGQEAKFQVGGQLGFRVLTTTQTSTLQSVNFLDVGVVLRVTPRISKDNQVLMHVKPEVSTGKINADGLPEAETTQVDTDALLADGQGMVIGGLIQEFDSNIQNKFAYLGDLWLVGKLFQRRVVDRRRAEVIITLIPRVVPYGSDYQPQECAEYTRSETPLLQGQVHEYPRPWEPKLYDTIENPRPLVTRLPRTDVFSTSECGDQPISSRPGAKLRR